MLHEEKKVSKIVEELTIFFFGIGATDMISSIKRDGNEVNIFFRTNYDKKFESKLEGMQEMLQEHRDEGMEDVYWELIGSGDPGETSQLLLIGIMVDSARVKREGDFVLIELKKTLCDY